MLFFAPFLVMGLYGLFNLVLAVVYTQYEERAGYAVVKRFRRSQQACDRAFCLLSEDPPSRVGERAQLEREPTRQKSEKGLRKLVWIKLCRELARSRKRRCPDALIEPLFDAGDCRGHGWLTRREFRAVMRLCFDLTVRDRGAGSNSAPVDLVLRRRREDAARGRREDAARRAAYPPRQDSAPRKPIDPVDGIEGGQASLSCAPTPGGDAGQNHEDSNLSAQSPQSEISRVTASRGRNHALMRAWNSLSAAFFVFAYFGVSARLQRFVRSDLARAASTVMVCVYTAVVVIQMQTERRFLNAALVDDGGAGTAVNDNMDLHCGLSVLGDICVLLFVLELLVNILGLGWVPFWNGGWVNRIDFVVVGIGAVGEIEVRLGSGGGGNQCGRPDESSSSLYKFVTFMRAIRLVRVLNAREEFRIVFSIFRSIIPALMRYVGVVFAIYYMWAVIGMELFAGTLRTAGSQRGVLDTALAEGVSPARIARVSESSYGVLGYEANNFDTIDRAVTVLFEQMIVNNWVVVMEGCVAGSTMNEWIVRAYFVTFNIVCVTIVLNVTVAFFIDSFKPRYHLAQVEREARRRAEAGLLDLMTTPLKTDSTQAQSRRSTGTEATEGTMISMDASTVPSELDAVDGLPQTEGNAPADHQLHWRSRLGAAALRYKIDISDWRIDVHKSGKGMNFFDNDGVTCQIDRFWRELDSRDGEMEMDHRYDESHLGLRGPLERHRAASNAAIRFAIGLSVHGPVGASNPAGLAGPPAAAVLAGDVSVAKPVACSSIEMASLASGKGTAKGICVGDLK